MSTTFMFMDLPVVSVTTGPEWATMLSDALSEVVDSHDHTSGKGVPIPSAGFNIDADLDFQQWSAINLVSSQYVSQTEAPDGSNLTYFLSGDLYVIDGSGRSVRITENGAISAASFGGITGLVSPASASFATDTFTWLYDTDKYALMATGPLVIRRTGETSPFPVILTPPASMPSPGYTLTFPSALSASNTYLLVNASGAMSFSTTAVVASVNSAAIDTDAVTTDKIAALQVTRAKQAAVGQQISSSSSTYTTSSASFTAITNLSVTITTTGRPVVVGTRSANALGASFFSYTAGPLASERTATIRLRDTSGGVSYLSEVVVKLENNSIAYAPSTILSGILSLSAGTYTLVVDAECTSGTSPTFSAFNVALFAYEL